MAFRNLLSPTVSKFLLRHRMQSESERVIMSYTVQSVTYSEDRQTKFFCILICKVEHKERWVLVSYLQQLVKLMIGESWKNGRAQSCITYTCK